MLTTFSDIFVRQYDESIGISSLNYISLAVGFTLGGQVGGRLTDRFYRQLKEKHGGKGRPEFKLPLMMITAFLIPVGFLLFGWTAEYKVHWIVPNIGAVIFSLGLMGVWMGIQMYSVDSFGVFAASAASAITIVRSLCGFGFPLFATSLYERLGYGWGNSVIALVLVVIGIPVPFLLWHCGPWLRSKSSYAVKPIAPSK